MAEALIYIPDISGFTKFVNNTEISHAQHIISELLEVIIDSNRLDLEVSEVEGDAILFYKETIPQLEDIFDQARETFLKFHQHLRKYESERVFRGGGCIRFVGTYQQSAVGGFCTGRRYHHLTRSTRHRLAKPRYTLPQAACTAHTADLSPT